MTSHVRTNRYGSIAAEIYDIDKPFGHLPDTAFHLDRLRSVDGEILEPGCGSGRTLVPLLQAGLNVAGFDASPDMLARCRERCAAAGIEASLTLQSFETFKYDRRFAAIVVPVGSFTLIDDFAAALDVLRRFRDHLHPDGLLVVDLQGLAFLAATRDDRRRWTTPEGDLLTVEGVRTETDWLLQRAERVYRYERWRDHRLIASEIDVMAQRYWGLAEFRLVLQRVGFGDIEVFGGYDRRRPPAPGDRAWTFEARAV